jgi:hypothetical protein
MCSYCHWGERDCIREILFQCARCEAVEGELPTDCPGRPMNEHEKLGVMQRTIDYRHNHGWVYVYTQEEDGA